jgi:predicted lipoprotein with Yx(FWY)xxD motif
MERTHGPRTSTLRASLGRIATAALALGVLSALAFAPGTAAAATRPTTARVISSAKNAKLGTILVARRTVYTLKPSKTACTAKCLKAWPPVLLPTGIMGATAGSGVDASKLGTVAAAKGALQVTYAGKRLYWFVKDKAPGQVHGNVKDQWGKWSTVVTSSASNTTNATATTLAPATTVPPTAAPETAAPDTAAPETAPPETSPPAPQATDPPMTQPPPTTSPGTGGIAF